MARGFGSTRGVGSTDKLVTSVNPRSGARTIFIVSNRNGSGGSGFGRLWDAQNSGASNSNIEQLFLNGSDSKLYYQRYMGTSLAQWTCTAPSGSAWHTIGLSFDSSSASNDPIIYIDGSSVTVTETMAPNGAASAGSAPYWIGNRPYDSARVWDGDHAELAIWNSILSSGDHASLASGTDPATIDSGNLILYVPLVSSLVATVGTDLTATGTAVTTHPAGFSDGGGGGSSIPAIFNHYNRLRRA